MRYRVQMHESAFSDSLLSSLLVEPIIDGDAILELDGFVADDEAAVAVAVGVAVEDEGVAAAAAA